MFQLRIMPAYNLLVLNSILFFKINLNYGLKRSTALSSRLVLENLEALILNQLCQRDTNPPNMNVEIIRMLKTFGSQQQRKLRNLKCFWVMSSITKNKLKWWLAKLFKISLILNYLLQFWRRIFIISQLTPSFRNILQKNIFL